MANTKITVANMAANSIDSDQYVDGSIDTAHIADGQITVGKMAANSVDSAQYVDGSIDTAHYADNSITGAELADNIVIAGTLGVTGKITTRGTTASGYNVLEFGTININTNLSDGTVDFAQGLAFTNNVTNEGAWTQAGICSTGSSGYNGNLVFGTDGNSSRTSNTITERMRITSTGAVGIGTAAPAFENGSGLEIRYAGGNGAHLKLTDAASGTGSTQGFDLYAFNTAAYIENYEAGAMVFRNNAAERMRILGDGNVIVGGTAALGGAKLSIDHSGAAIIGADTSSSGGGYIQLLASDSSKGLLGFGSNSGASSINNVALRSQSGDIEFHTGGANERMRINASGNISLACTSDYKTLTVGDTDAEAWITSGGSNTHLTLSANGTSGAVILRTGGTNGDPSATTERMRIDPSGNLIVGKSVSNLTLGGLYVAPNDFMVYTNTSTDTGDRLLVLNRQNATGELVDFRYQNSTVGKITMNGSATNYGTGSDYRLKENVVTDWDATTRLKQLKPSRFNFITDGDTTVDGFIAHEVQEIVPEAITGEKDAVDSEGNPVMQGIDQSKLVPLLTKAIQEQQAQIEIQNTLITNLTARIETLEG